MEAAKGYSVILNVYDLTPSASEENGSSTVSFFSRLLKPIGFGAYHTSIEVNGYCYTFSAISGIHKSSSSNRASHVPPNGEFKESIKLGSLSDEFDQNKINECINKLRRSFTERSYHLACRNCNHFTETFANALFLVDAQISAEANDKKGSSLNTYPSWVNRLAKSSNGLLKHDDICDVMKEARYAADVEGKVGWGLESSNISNEKSKNESSKKKSLTEEQKKALAKLRKK